MDKFRKIATDPFCAGIVEVDRQVKVRNINGVHQPLISVQTHNKILHVFNRKSKNQLGPIKNGNSMSWSQLQKNREEASELEYRINTAQAGALAEQERFLRFALTWIERMGSKFLSPNPSRENRLRCKQIVFPADFHLNEKQKRPSRN